MNIQRLSIRRTLFCLFLAWLFIFPVRAQETLERKIAQMVMVGFSPYSNFRDTLHYDIEHRNLGGVLLFAGNLENPQQIVEMNAALQDMADTPLLIATDQEGGSVARLDENNGFSRTPTAYHLGTVVDSEDSTRRYAGMMADWLSSTGINTNLAPVADVNVNPSSPAIGYFERSFSSDPDKVTDHVSWFASESAERGVMTALKHFPGHGSAEQDSHLGFTDITETWSGAELVPYRELISDGYSGMVMAGHLYNAKIDSVYPASLSEKTISGLLRDSLGFRGVVITDAMSMRAISNNYSFDQAVVLAVKAGADILLYPGNQYHDVSLVSEVIRVVREHVDLGIITEEQITESYDRIMALKAQIPVSVAAREPLVPELSGLHAYPNPFNRSTCIRFRVVSDISDEAEIRIYDISGRFVQRFTVDVRGAGEHTVSWNGTDKNGRALPSGTYIYIAELNNTLSSGKVSLLK